MNCSQTWLAAYQRQPQDDSFSEPTCNDGAPGSHILINWYHSHPLWTTGWASTVLNSTPPSWLKSGNQQIQLHARQVKHYDYFTLIDIQMAAVNSYPLSDSSPTCCTRKQNSFSLKLAKHQDNFTYCLQWHLLAIQPAAVSTQETLLRGRIIGQ